MGIFDKIFKKNKFDRLTREDVVDAIYNIEKMEDEIEKGVVERTKQINDLMQKGKNEKDNSLRLFYAKKITMMREENQEDVKRGMYLLYNAKLLRRLKSSIEDNNFFVNASSASLGNLLSDQKGLAQFLNKALDTRIKSESVLTDADETWQEVQGLYEQNEKIYGVANRDDELLSMFETESQLDGELARTEEVSNVQEMAVLNQESMN